MTSRSFADEPQRLDQPGAKAPTEKKDDGSFRIGPLVGIGFPRPLAIEAFVKLRKQFGVGLEYSLLPRVSAGGTSVRFDAIAVDGRWFPFKGGFFIGLRGGRQWLSGASTLTVTNVGSFTETADADTWFSNPRLGFLYTLESGITLGIDAGIQIPIGATYERAGPATSAGLAQGTSVDTTLRQVANTLGNEVTPTVDLFRLGFLF